MIVEKGDTVVLIETDQLRLEPYIGSKWTVQAIVDNGFPVSAIITRDDLQATVAIKNLEVVPPPGSAFDHGEAVKIDKPYSKTNHRTCNKALVGKVGRVKNYDSKINYYFIKCLDGESGWFPTSSLIPIDFKGDKFYYPLQQVKYKDKEVFVHQVKRTKFNFGQLLLINGQWVPSTEVEPLE